MNEEWWKNTKPDPVRSGYSVVDTVTLEERELSVHDANHRLQQECNSLRAKLRNMEEQIKKLQIERDLLMQIVLKK
jgi:hypothetical protein